MFPIWFQNLASGHLTHAETTSRYALATTCALLAVAVLAPLLGAVADLYPVKKRLLGVFMSLGALCTLGLALTGTSHWGWSLVLFALGNVGAFLSFVFYDALLPHVAKSGEVDRVSTAGYALGYLGGGLLLAVNLLWIVNPERFGLSGPDDAVRLAFVSVAVWWVVFSIPLLRKVPEPPPSPDVIPLPVRLKQTFRELLAHREATLMLAAFLIYNDGIVTIIRMATVYGSEIGLPANGMIIAILLVQFAGIPFAFLFGLLANRIGTRQALLVGLAVYVLICVLGYRMDNVAEFYLLAFLVATVQGGCQALSRSLFASMIPKQKSAEFFSLFAVCEKAASVAGPALFGLVTAWSGSGRSAVLVMVLFFVVGAAVLSRVDVAAGRAQVRDPAQG